MLTSMSRRVFVPAALSLALVLAAPPTDACSCKPPSPPAEAMAERDAVFEARVAEVRADPSEGRSAVTLEVLRSWKGVDASSLTVTTSGSSASCGFHFEEGERYLVYADAVEGALWVSLCSRTAPIDSAQKDLAVLGEPAFVPSDSGPAAPPVDPAPSAPPPPVADPSPSPPTPSPAPPPASVDGGCAGCAVGGSGEPHDGLGWLLLGVALAWRRFRHRR